MFYRVTANLNLTSKEDAKKIFNDLALIAKAGMSVNIGFENQESSFAKLEECLHDQDPSEVCRVLKATFSPLPPNNNEPSPSK